MDNLVSRQAAIDEFEKELSAKYNKREMAIGFVGVKSIIDTLPSVQPEQKKGKWITEPYNLENDIWAHRCSNCLKVAMLGGNDINLNYCPNCGADMRGEQSVSDK